MKGIFIQSQLEFRLEVPGEKFHQGDVVACTLTVKNHGGSVVNLPSLFLQLAKGNNKKVKEKAADAFETLSEATLSAPGEVASQQQKTASWKFELSKNAAISDKAQSLYLVFGSRDISGASFSLPLTVEIHPHLQKVIEIFETAFQFVLKGVKASSDGVEAKFAPPTAQRFSVLEELLLTLQFKEDSSLGLGYIFKVKKFQATDANSISVKKGKTTLEQIVEESRYLIPGGFINHEVLEGVIGEALAGV